MVVTSIDAMTHKKMLSTSILEWLLDHDMDVERWTEEHIAESSHTEFYRKIVNPYEESVKFLAYQLLKENRTLISHGGLERVAQKFMQKKGQIYLICGAKRGGKTVLAFALAYLAHLRGIPVYYYGIPTELPWFFKKTTMDWDNLPLNCLIVADETSIIFWNRHKGMDENSVIQKLPILGHGGRNAIFITQNTAIIDVNLIRLADGVLFKTWTQIQDNTERKLIAGELKYFMPQRKEECLFWDNEEIIFFRHGLPVWWKKDFSETFKPFASREDAIYATFELLLERKLDAVVELVMLRSPKLNDSEFRAMDRIVEFYGTGFVRDMLAGAERKHLCHLMNNFIDEKPITEKEPDLFDEPKFYDFEVPYETRKRWEEKPDDDKRNIDVCLNREVGHELRKSVLERNAIICFAGFMGTGKSWAMCAMADWITHMTLKRNFSVQNVKYSTEEALSSLNNLSPGDAIAKDEVTQSWGAGSGREEGELNNAIETLRKARINFLFASPTLKLDPRLVKFVFEPHGIDKKAGVAKLFVYRAEEYPRRPDGYVTIGKPRDSFLVEYETRKDEYLKRVKERSTSEKDFEKIADAVIQKSKEAGFMLKGRKEWIAYATKLYPNRAGTETDQIATWCMIKEKQKE